MLNTYSCSYQRMMMHRLISAATWELPLCAARPDEEFEIAAITIAELWHGVERAKGAQRAKREGYLQSVLASLPIITTPNGAGTECASTASLRGRSKIRKG